MMFSRKKRVAPVTSEDGERAKQHLQHTTNFDIDQFLAEHTAEVLFNTPLGPTPRCLNVDQVADAAAGKANHSAAEHLRNCDSCSRQVSTYLLLDGADFTGVTREIDIVATIRVPRDKDLYLVLFNRGNVPILATIDPSTFQVSGPVEGKVEALEPVDPTKYDAREAVVVRFKSYRLNVSDSGEVHDYLSFSAKTNFGRFEKRRMVHVIDESKKPQARQYADMAV